MVAELRHTEASVTAVRVLPASQWSRELPDLAFAVETQEGGRTVARGTQTHPLAGAGKLFLGLTVAEITTRRPDLRSMTLPVRNRHRQGARTGTLRMLSGEMSLSLDDAVNLVFSTGDGASALALLEFLEMQGVDVVHTARELVARLGMNNTRITAAEREDDSWGEGLTGVTAPEDLLVLLNQLCAVLGEQTLPGAVEAEPALLTPEAAHLTVGWMRQVFEPGGLASALPGYGPHRVPHWTLSGWELAAAGAEHGTVSVLITHSAEAGWVCAAAYCRAWERKAEAHSPRDVSAALGTLGLSAYLNKQA